MSSGGIVRGSMETGGDVSHFLLLPTMEDFFFLLWVVLANLWHIVTLVASCVHRGPRCWTLGHQVGWFQPISGRQRQPLLVDLIFSSVPQFLSSFETVEGKEPQSQGPGSASYRCGQVI